jgi:hypothetical protein
MYLAQSGFEKVRSFDINSWGGCGGHYCHSISHSPNAQWQKLLGELSSCIRAVGETVLMKGCGQWGSPAGPGLLVWRGHADSRALSESSSQ